MADLIVEDGTGLLNADAFVSVEFCTTFCTDRELNGWLDGAGDQQAAIRRATDFMSNSFTYRGFKLKGRLQALAFPRSDIFDDEDNLVDPNSVPVEIEQATCILAAFEMANPGALSPAVILANRIRSETIGPLRTEYVVGSLSANEFRPVLMNVDDLISELVVGGGNNSVSGSVARG